MKVVFRVDASIQMGTGHVMRCLTLADVLRKKNVECYFICREHAGHLITLIRQKGYQVYVLPYVDVIKNTKEVNVTQNLAHASWLGTTQAIDSSLCVPIVEGLKPEWIIVDHYALDTHWEQILRPYVKRIMVIDDLADRQHDCDLLLDQTFGRNPNDYVSQVSHACRILCGAEYALLRSEFIEWRSFSIERRRTSQLRHLLINLGGVDKDNITTQILLALKQSVLPADLKITVVMGSTAPWIKEVNQQAKKMPWSTDVVVGVSNMAELMAKSDLAIGAAGSTSWERCCLGLPSIVVVLADNQNKIAKDLQKYGAALSIQQKEIKQNLLAILNQLSILDLKRMQTKALQITEGLGAEKLLSYMNIESNIC